MADFTAQQRAALAMWLLQQQPLTTREIAERCSFTMQGAWYMLSNISCKVPLYYESGRWHLGDGTDGPR